MGHREEGNDDRSELKDAIKRNRERTEHIDHEEFEDEYFSGED
ncbi:hypothetical protein ATJ93_0816 [Halopiger aswanensis]|uniref:Uncharacterized protein n=1 Tax=Halopiger aswanensis TaxID=148449 RepID=A0A419WQW6_9EURY|nr:hypothetical protein ATJ93_0816 [Halopiger aswanensis]